MLVFATRTGHQCAMRCLLPVFLFLILLTPKNAQAERPVEGVILVIADGTSSELLTATRIWKYGASGRLDLENLPHSAFVRTFSANNLVTDSSAAATALARGQKADNAAVGVTDPPSESIVALARRAGWSTAILTDDEIQGGTPAPFYAVADRRLRFDLISREAIEAMGPLLDVLAGGGASWLTPDRRPDDAAIHEQLAANAELLARSPARQLKTWAELAAVQDLTRPVLATLWDGTAPYFADGKRDVRLADLAVKILELLQGTGKPYLFIVEAALPDKAAHLNSARRAMTEVLEFDETIRRLRARAGERTLLLATTDHGTGGLALNGYLPRQMSGDALLKTNPLTKAPVFSWASGPGVQSPPLQPDPLAPDATQPSLIPRPSALHTGGDVWLFGQGPGSEAVHGFLDNTDIFRIMKTAIER